MVFAGAISPHLMVQAVMDEVTEKHNGSKDDEEVAKQLGVRCYLCSNQDSGDSVQGMEECE